MCFFLVFGQVLLIQSYNVLFLDNFPLGLIRLLDIFGGCGDMCFFLLDFILVFVLS